MGGDQLAQRKHSLRPSETLALLISRRLARLAAIYGREVERETCEVWVDAVKFLTPTQIQAGFDRMEKTFIPTAACPFPVPAQLMSVIADAQGNKALLDAEQAWVDAELWLSRWYEDCRDKEYPLIDPRIMKSMEAAGGLSYVKNCPLKDYAWAKKRFIEAYLSLGQLERDQPLLVATQMMRLGEAKESIREQLGAIAQTKELK